MNRSAQRTLEELRARKWWRGIAPGDTVKFTRAVAPRGQGRVAISTPTHVVINAGGRDGTPVVVNESNFSAHIIKSKSK